MATLPATGYLSDSARTEAEMQTAFEALRDFVSQLPASAEVQLTISAGTITPATRDQGSVKIETEAAAASDDLATIAQTNVSDGGLLLIRAHDAAHTVVVKHAAGGTGQIYLQYNGDFSLDDTDKWLLVKRVGTAWEEVFRSWGNDPAAERTALAAAALAANTFTGVQRWAKGADVASANALTLGTDGNYFDITGTTSITSIGTLGVGTVVKLHFDGALTLTHHATDLILPTGGNITTAAGDEAEFVEYASGDWRCTNYTRATGKALLAGGTMGSPTTTTSGTSHDYTGFPAGTSEILISFAGVSLNGSSDILVQIGDSGGFETTGYVSTGSTDANTSSSTAGFVIRVAAAANVFHGQMLLNLCSAAAFEWVAGYSGRIATTAGSFGGGSKALSAELTQVRITTVNGTDTFDAGKINVIYR